MNQKELELEETESPVAFPNVVRAYVGANIFTLDWQATSDSQRAGSTWTSAGATQNPLYLTFADPVLGAAVNLYHTLVHLGSKDADGKARESDVISAVWSDFTDRDVRRIDGTQLRYWHGGSATAVNTRQLLAHANGQCGSWAHLFIDTLRGQGITGPRKILVFSSDEPLDPATGLPVTPWNTSMLVKRWTFAGAGSSPATAPYTYTIADLTDEEGVPGQGNANPPSAFGNHFLVVLDGKYYDPSYGTGPFSSENEWENASLDGFGRDFGFIGYRYKKNDPTVLETVFIQV